MLVSNPMFPFSVSSPLSLSLSVSLVSLSVYMCVVVFLSYPQNDERASTKLIHYIEIYRGWSLKGNSRLFFRAHRVAPLRGRLRRMQGDSSHGDSRRRAEEPLWGADFRAFHDWVHLKSVHISLQNKGKKQTYKFGHKCKVSPHVI